jgi:hypothetical protein
MEEWRSGLKIINEIIIGRGSVCRKGSMHAQTRGSVACTE